MQRRIWLVFWVLLALLGGYSPGAAQGEGRQVLVLTSSGALTPSMLEYLKRGIRLAEAEGAEALIFELNTPGGSLDLMNRMVTAIRESQVPVIVYIQPRGAMAGSAGTVITLAGHAAVMAPETTIGAASPVGPEGEELGETIAAKEKNILRATVRSLAARRGQKAIDLAEQTIESAQAASSTEALQIGLIDFIASDRDDLLRQLDGFQVELAGPSTGPLAGGTVALHTAGAQVIQIQQSFIEQLLATLTNPNIVFLLLAVGVQAILIELSSPGGWVAGFVGVVCLALATYGLGILPVNWFGLLFLALAFILFVLDIKAPTHGALTAAGVGSLIVGGLVLFNSPSVPSFLRVSVPLIVVTSLLSGGMFFMILLFALRAQRSPVRMGQETLAGKVGVARSELNPSGLVQLGGEQWTAEIEDGAEPVAKGARVEVLRVEGLRLRVRQKN